MEGRPLGTQSQSRAPEGARQKRRESKRHSEASEQKEAKVIHGRFVQGIKKALATCVPIVGFSFNRRMLYSYHFSP